MLAQTTDSGSNNGPMAEELESMFAMAEEPESWDSSAHHVRCYAHKLNLTVGHGLRILGQKVQTKKPSIPKGVPLPIPVLEVNDGNDGIEIDSSKSDEEDSIGLPDQPDGVDDDDGSLDIDEEVCQQDDIVAIALEKVSFFFFFLYKVSKFFFSFLLLNIGRHSQWANLKQCSQAIRFQDTFRASWI